ncbi:MAG: LysR family transcriptional regulator [Lachnospiraceae bacterium]|nr:LysR family transcriptional regulator [Lachnospiraceae bacterium]
MDINYFNEFTTLANTGSFSETASKLNLTQSALSKHIKSMEKELGETLIIRTTKKFQITEYGQLFLRDARQIAAVQQHYTDILEDIRRNRSGHLRIGSISMMPHYNLTSLFTNYQEQYPAVHLEISTGREGELTEALLRDRCELAFMRFCDLPESQVEQTPLVDDYSCIVLSRKHPLAERKTVSLNQLKNEQFILLGGSRGPSGAQERLFNDSGFSPTNTMFLSNYTNILDLIRYNIGITVMTYYTAQFLAGETMAILPLEPRYPIELSLYYLKKHALSPAATAFISYVREHRDTLFQHENDGLATSL